MRTIVTRIDSGHTNNRRVIWDLVQRSDAAGGKPLYQLSLFDPVYAGAQIGGARPGYGHYHKNMWETYLILRGKCVMSLNDLETGEVVHHTLEVSESDPPWKIEIPPQTIHRLIAIKSTMLLIAATCPQVPEDTFEAELPDPK